MPEADEDFSQVPLGCAVPVDTPENVWAQGWCCLTDKHGNDWEFAASEYPRLQDEWKNGTGVYLEGRSPFGSLITLRRGDIVGTCFRGPETVLAAARYEIWRRSLKAPGWKDGD
jgi:hypothetical protein